jgi:hypothetical protein
MVLVSAVLLPSDGPDNCPVSNLLQSGPDFDISHSHFS